MKSFQSPSNEVGIIGKENELSEIHKQRLHDRAKEYMRKARSENTLRVYGRMWREFADWCEDHGYSPLPATEETVIYYLTDLADNGSYIKKENGTIERKPLKAQSIQQRLYAIQFRHKTKGFVSPTHSIYVKDTMAGIKSDKGTAPDQKRAADVEIIKAICRTIPDDLTGIRNRALLLTGFGFGSRRSELVNVHVEHVRFTHKGMEIFIPRSKTDQQGKGRTPVIFYGQSPETCPVRSLQKWLKVSGITSGPVFRKIDKHGNIGRSGLSADGFRYIFNQLIKQAGFEPSDFSPHSLRSGLITTAHLLGRDEHSIMQQTGHKSIQIMRRYIDSADRYINNVTDGIGL
jgi:integrase